MISICMNDRQHVITYVHEVAHLAWIRSLSGFIPYLKWVIWPKLAMEIPKIELTNIM